MADNSPNAVAFRDQVCKTAQSKLFDPYNQAVGRIAHLDKNSMHIVADVCFFHHSARADAL